MLTSCRAVASGFVVPGRKPACQPTGSALPAKRDRRRGRVAAAQEYLLRVSPAELRDPSSLPMAVFARGAPHRDRGFNNCKVDHCFHPLSTNMGTRPSTARPSLSVRRSRTCRASRERRGVWSGFHSSVRSMLPDESRLCRVQTACCELFHRLASPETRNGGGRALVD